MGTACQAADGLARPCARLARELAEPPSLFGEGALPRDEPRDEVACVDAVAARADAAGALDASIQMHLKGRVRCIGLGLRAWRCIGKARTVHAEMLGPLQQLTFD